MPAIVKEELIIPVKFTLISVLSWGANLVLLHENTE